MILHEPAETRHREIHVRPPERLPKLTRISREEISQRAEEIYAVEAVWYIGPQSDAIQCSADLPKVFAPRARIRVARLIMILATFAVPRIGPPEGNQSSDNLRAERLVCAQDGMACGDLKAQIANGFRAYDSGERSRKSVVAREAASSRTCVYEAVGVERIT